MGDPNPQGTQAFPIFNYFSPLAEMPAGAAMRAEDPAPSWPHGAAELAPTHRPGPSPASSPRSERAASSSALISVSEGGRQRSEVSAAAPSVLAALDAAQVSGSCVQGSALAVGGALPASTGLNVLSLPQRQIPLPPERSLAIPGPPVSATVTQAATSKQQVPALHLSVYQRGVEPPAEGSSVLGIGFSDEEADPLCTPEIKGDPPQGQQQFASSISSYGALPLPVGIKPMTSQHLSPPMRGDLNDSDHWATEDPRGCPSPRLTPPSFQQGREVSPAHASSWTSSPGASHWTLNPPHRPSQPESVMESPELPVAPVSSSASLIPPEEALLALQGHPELQALLSLLPSKQDMLTLATEMRASWQRDLHVVQTDVSTLQARVQTMEDSHASLQSQVSSLQQASATRDALHRSLITQMDDQENRNRRNNVRLRGVPESIRPQDLTISLTRFFNSILGRGPEEKIELDRAHRALRPQSTDPSRPRDVICRIHLYSLKEEIMRKARTSGELTINGSKIDLFPDLSRRTLRLRASLRPLLNALQSRNIVYRWGFPFALHVRHHDTTLTFRTPADLPILLKALDLPPIRLPDWDLAFLNLFPPTDTGTAEKHPLALTPKHQRSRRRLGPPSSSGTGT